MFIPGYAVAQEIYRNAHSVTYRATELATGTAVLLKIALVGSDEGNLGLSLHQQRERFVLEHSILQKLQGNAALSPLLLQDDDDALALVCTDFAGESLAQLAANQALALEDFFSIAMQLSELLGALHQHDVIHLNLHLAALLYALESKQIKVADFGYASQFSREYQPIVSPQILHGNLAFISPEQTGRMNRAIDYRSDFYSLGVIFYRLLTGQLPFSAQDAMGMVHCHIAQEPDASLLQREQIPPALAQIVLKLLAKTAEQRYQSAFGLRADLQQCERQWRSGQACDDFIPGSADISSRFLIPQKLYGREAAIEQLQQAFAQLNQVQTQTQAQASMILVRGQAGIGKSTLVNEIHQLAAKGQYKGYFATGRCDQYRGNQPYYAIIEAFQQLTRQLLTESEERLAYWRREMQAALGNNGQIILDLLPEIEWIIGPQAPLPTLAASESQNRFNAVLQNFIAIFARSEHPLTLFIDDLHWADTATLRLLHTLLLDASNGPLLLLVAYRDNEVASDSPLAYMLDNVQCCQIALRSIHLQALNEAHIQELIVDTLKCPSPAAQPLAELVYSKTHGMPFFVNQLLHALFAAHLIEFDATQGKWVWDIAAIQKSPISDNVIDLMLQNIRRLDPATQNLLQYAATLGLHFDVETLSLVTGLERELCSQQLRQAQQDGLIQRSQEERASEPHANMGKANLFYEFQHPRIQQALYSLISPEQAQAMHLQVGRTLATHLSAAKRQERIFDIVNHLNVGQALVVGLQEQVALAQLNLQAGQRAASSIAYDTAANYFSSGIACLPSDCWQTAYLLTYQLHVQYANALANTGQSAQAYVLYQQVIQHANSAYDKAAVCEQYSIALQNSGEAGEALRLVKQGLAIFEIHFPDNAEAIALETAQLLGTLTQEDSIAYLRQLPQMPQAGQDDKLIDRLYERCIISIYFTEPQHLSLIISRNVQHVLQRGITPEAGVALAWFAMILRMSGQVRQSFEHGELALQLSQQFDDPYFRGKTELLAHCQSLCWKYPFFENEAALQAAFQLCHSVGDLQYASYCHFTAYVASLTQGANFNRILELCQVWHDYCEKYVPLELGQAKIRLAAHRHLMGIALPELDVDAILGNYEQEKNSTDVSEALIEMAHCAAIFGEYEEAWQYCERAAPLIAAGAVGSLLLMMRYQHVCVICCAQLYQGQTSLQSQFTQAAEEALAQIKLVAEISPDNFLSHYKFALAQWQRAQGDEEQAASAYLCAISHARRHGYVLLQAWANEMLAEMYAQDGWQVAPAYRDEAQRLYRECDAFGKAGSMQLRGASVSNIANFATPVRSSAASLATIAPEQQSERVQSAVPSRAQRALGPQLLDLSAIVKSSQAISSEIELEKLIERMMHIIVENAGAQDGMLLLYQGEALVLHALVEQRVVRLMHGREPAFGINWAVIHYVVRTNAPVVLDNAAHDGPFVRDTWVMHWQPRSVLCVPLLNQGRITGIIYLENNLVTGAFTPDRIAVLELMASQAAIALQNARLYSDLQREQTLIRELNESLERRVIERTFEAESARKRLTDLTEALPLTVFQSRAEEGKLRYVFVSENVRDMLGVSADEIKLDPEARWRNVLPEDREKCRPLVQQAITDMCPCEFSQRVEFEGRVRWIHAFTVGPKWIDGAWVWNGFWIDETRSRLQEDELREAKNLAEAATRTKSMFLANMSHEIRTPMNAIIGLSHLALMTQLNERQHDYLAKIHNAGTALLGIINDILDFSKIEAGQLTVETTDFMLSQVTDNLQAMLGQKMSSKGLQLVFDLAPDLPQCLSGDPLRLGQIFINLLSNAVKFTERGEIRLSGKVLEVVGARVKLKFSVRDNGIGIAPEQAQRLFQAFTQADDSTSRKYGGTGLGLSICKSLVELMGGNIWVESQPKMGSTFFFTAWFGLGAGQVEKPANNQRNTRFDGMSVLLVEDNVINQQIAVELLQLAGIAVDVAEHGGIAIEMLQADKRYDLVLMDLQMPQVDGYTATAAIRRTHSKASLPIIAMTAYAMSDERQRCLDAGMNDHISKPIDPDMLFDALARWRRHTNTSTSTSTSTSQTNPPSPSPHAPSLSIIEASRRAPAIDVASALRRVGGNQSLYHKLLGRFASKSTTTVQEIQLALLSGASQEAERMAHTVRGVAGNLGAMLLADAACDLELAINANAENVGQALHAFEQCMQDFVQEAQALLDEQGVG